MAYNPANASIRDTEQTNMYAASCSLSLYFKNAITPMPIAAPPIVISINAMIIKIVLRDINPQHTPFAKGMQKQNFGSLAYERL